MNAELATTYRAERARGMSPRYLATHLRREVSHLPLPLVWNGNLDKATIDLDGFEVTVKLVPDDTAETEYLGTWSNEPKSSDAVDRKRTGKWGGRGHARYWNPPDTMASLWGYYRASKLGKHAAWVAARNQLTAMYKDAEDFVTYGGSYGIVVEVERADVTLARASLWGVDILGTRPHAETEAYLTMMAADVIWEGIEDAKSKLDALCGCGEAS